VTQQTPQSASGNDTSSGRQSANSGWWKSTSGLGTLLYTGTFVVPAGETWEVDYACQYKWSTDDTGGIQWSLDDALADDGIDTGYSLSQSAYEFNQTFILTAGTHVARVKAIIGSGSGSDSITFPWHTPSHLVVKKFKSN
jgi:hypothetical protein